MEEKQQNSTTTLNEEDDQYFDSFEDFPFLDCTSNPESPEQQQQQQNSTEISNISQLSSSMQERADILIKRQITTQSDEISSNEKNGMLKSDVESTETSKEEIFTENSLASSSFLVFLAGLVIKAIGFQVSLLISFISLPIWISYCFVMLIIDPCKTLKQVKRKMLKKSYRVWGLFSETFAPFLFEKVKGQKSIAKLVMKFGWGFVWSIYICVVLFGLLVSGFLIGGFVMRCLVEEPMQLVESLNFDYTRTSPVALVPIISCPSVYTGVKYQDGIAKNVAGFRVLPPNHKLQLTVLLTMPESDYNRKLGIFQVRVDFLSENGQVTASSRHPCMLQFKSHLIRYLEIFLKSVPLLASPHLKLKF